MDLNSIDNDEKLLALLGEQFLAREQSIANTEQAVKNINAIVTRRAKLAKEAEAAVNKTRK